MKFKVGEPKNKGKTNIFPQPAPRACKNCLKGKRLTLTNDVLCREKGVVSENYCCSSHHYFIIDDFKRMDFYRCCDCEFFVFHPHETITSYGVCGMFSVRKCDGSLRKACSKFIRRREFSA